MDGCLVGSSPNFSLEFTPGLVNSDRDGLGEVKVAVMGETSHGPFRG